MSGSTDHIIRIYQMTPGPPERIAELDVHNVSHTCRKFIQKILCFLRAVLCHIQNTIIPFLIMKLTNNVISCSQLSIDKI